MRQLFLQPLRQPLSTAMRLVAFAALICCFANVTIAQQSPMTISLLDGTTIESSISSITQSGTVAGPAIDPPLNLNNVIAIESTGAGADAIPTKDANQRTRVVLVGGGVLFCDGITIDDGVLQTTNDAGIDTIPLDIIEAILFRDSDLAARTMEDRSTQKDTIVVQTPDGLKMVAGIFEGIADGKVLLNFNGATRKINLIKISAIILADLAPTQPRGLRSTVAFNRQSQINGVIQTLSDGQLAISLTAEVSISVSFERVRRIDIQTDNLAYLSILKPVAVEQQTIFSLQRSWQRDASIEGNPIQLNYYGDSGSRVTRPFAKGLGMQSYSSLQFANDKEFTRFKATVGIDAETNGRGDCVMKVVSDGISLWSSRVTATQDPIAVDVDITGMQNIELIVEPGEQFDLADHADWANARFVKTQ